MIILTWNRDFEDAWPDDDYEKCKRVTDTRRRVKFRWSVGRSKNIPKNSEVFFFVQGVKHTRGLVASGITVGAPYSGKHWRDPKRKTNYVELKLTKLLNLNETIPVALLQEKLPDVPWHAIRQSGLSIKEEYRETLRDLWTNFSGVDEIPEPGELKPQEFIEGGYRTIKVKGYERDPAARTACLLHYGSICFVCGVDIEMVYGSELGSSAIHVHHVKPMSIRRKSPYKINPIKDLIPVCPNCHNIIHKKNPVLTPLELQKIYKSRNRKNRSS